MIQLAYIEVLDSIIDGLAVLLSLLFATTGRFDVKNNKDRDRGKGLSHHVGAEQLPKLVDIVDQNGAERHSRHVDCRLVVTLSVL